MSSSAPRSRSGRPLALAWVLVDLEHPDAEEIIERLAVGHQGARLTEGAGLRPQPRVTEAEEQRITEAGEAIEIEGMPTELRKTEEGELRLLEGEGASYLLSDRRSLDGARALVKVAFDGEGDQQTLTEWVAALESGAIVRFFVPGDHEEASDLVREAPWS